MQQVLKQINTLPGVIGSLVRSVDGQVAAFAFPPLFDAAILQEASRSLSEVFGSLSSSEGPEMLDFRFAEGRVLVKPVVDAHLLLLCTKEVNLSTLTISLNVAIKKLERLLPETASQPLPAEPVPGGGLYLEAANLVSSSVTKGFEQLGMVAINQHTAQKINSYFDAGNVKKVKLTSPASGKSGVFPLMVVNDLDNKYDGMLILAKNIGKKLGASAGDRLQVQALL